MLVTFGGSQVLFGGQLIDFGTPGPVGAGATTEASGDSAAANGFYSPTNNMRMYGVNPATIIRFSTDSLGIQLTGTSLATDRWLLPTSYIDPADSTVQSIQWELDVNGNATGRISNMAGSGQSTNLPYMYYNSTIWLTGTFSTSGANATIPGSGATTEGGPDTVSSSGSLISIGSGATTESGPGTAAGSGTIGIAGSGATTESGPDTVSGSGSVLIAGTGAAIEPAGDSASSSGTPVATGIGSAVEPGPGTASGSGTVSSSGTGAAIEGQDTASATGTTFLPGSGSAVEAGPDTAAGSGTVPIAGIGAIIETVPDTAAGAGIVDIAGSGNAQEVWQDVTAGSGVVSGGVTITGSGNAAEELPDTTISTGVVSTGPAPIPTPTNPSNQVWITWFRGVFPEFASTAFYPTPVVEFWHEFATGMLPECRWGKQWQMAVALYVAHNLVLERRAVMEAKNGGVPGQSVGILSSKSVDKVSAGYDTSTGTQQGAGYWNLSTYGTRLYRLILLFGAGPIQVSGPNLAPPYSGLAWPGPDTTPGMTSFGS